MNDFDAKLLAEIETEKSKNATLLVELEGTEKQVAWANEIRKEALEDIFAPRSLAAHLKQMNDDDRAAATEYLTSGLRLKAVWWIQFKNDLDMTTRVRCAIAPETRSKYYKSDEEMLAGKI